MTEALGLSMHFSKQVSVYCGGRVRCEVRDCAAYFLYLLERGCFKLLTLNESLELLLSSPVNNSPQSAAGHLVARIEVTGIHRLTVV